MKYRKVPLVTTITSSNTQTNCSNETRDNTIATKLNLGQVEPLIVFLFTNISAACCCGLTGTEERDLVNLSTVISNHQLEKLELNFE